MCWNRLQTTAEKPIQGAAEGCTLHPHLNLNYSWRHKVQDQVGFMRDIFPLADNKTKQCSIVGARKRCEYGGTLCTRQATDG